MIGVGTRSNGDGDDGTTSTDPEQYFRFLLLQLVVELRVAAAEETVVVLLLSPRRLFPTVVPGRFIFGNYFVGLSRG